MLDDSTMLQLFEARKIVEVGNVSLAAQRITDEELAALRVCLDKIAFCPTNFPTHHELRH